MSKRIYLGAEAEILAETFAGRPSVAKVRTRKAYRHPDLDARLRRERTRLEASLLVEARAAGVPVPSIVDVDVAAATIRMRRVGGPRLREAIEERPEEAVQWSRRWGALVGRLHAAGLVHGDLTTSNVHLEDGELVLLDFGLAARGVGDEERGVDLHLVERTFESTHPGREGLFEAFLEGYRSALPRAEVGIRRMAEIKARARYA